MGLIGLDNENLSFEEAQIIGLNQPLVQVPIDAIYSHLLSPVRCRNFYDTGRRSIAEIRRYKGGTSIRELWL